MFTTADSSDTQQLARHLAEVRLSVQQWRQQRPALMVQSAQFVPSVGAGTLLLRYAPRRLTELHMQPYTRSGNHALGQLVHVVILSRCSPADDGRQYC